MTQEALTDALTLMEGLACPRSLTVAILIRAGEWMQLIKLRADPLDYCDAEDFWAANAATELLRKCKDLPLSHDKQQTAMETWWDAEHKCAQTNLRLSSFLNDSLYPEPEDERIFDFLSEVRKTIVDLIGSRPPELLQGKFGPGATLSDAARACTVADKITSVPTLTPNAWPHLIPWTGTVWASAQAKLGQRPKFVRGGTLFFVDKTALTLRSCEKGPSLNLFYQLACGKTMRRRMKRSRGIDLDNGSDLHGRLARIGSLTGELSTIDLSSASDTVSCSLVKLVLPPRWFELLESLRNPLIQHEGKWIKLEKFSSMGNGYTFELETAIFYSIVSAIQKMRGVPGVISAFGDDIICPTSIAVDVIAALKWCGFSPNTRKTYISGEFRESCGEDFFRGVPVRAHYLEEIPNAPEDFISFANGLRRTCGTLRKERWHKLVRAWDAILSRIPKHIRELRGPLALGDLVVHDFEEHWISRWRSSIRYIRVYRPVSTLRAKWERYAYDVQFATALYLAGSGPKSRDRFGDLIPRDSVTGYKVGWVPFS
jgi:hypothetical protein